MIRGLRPERFLLAPPVLVLGLCFATTAWAQASAAAPAQPATGTSGAPRGYAPHPPQQAQPAFVSPLRPEGGHQWSVFYGAGFNQSIRGSAGGIQLATGGLRWSHMWGESLGSFLRGHPTVALEFVPVMAFLETDQTSWGAGANLLYEHHFAVPGRVLPVFKLGVGVLYANREIPARETQHNFSVLSALGVDVVITDRSALFLGYRFHHISNANTGPLNPGVNVHSLMFGLSFYR